MLIILRWIKLPVSCTTLIKKNTQNTIGAFRLSPFVTKVNLQPFCRTTHACLLLDLPPHMIDTRNDNENMNAFVWSLRNQSIVIPGAHSPKPPFQNISKNSLNLTTALLDTCSATALPDTTLKIHQPSTSPTPKSLETHQT